jgi:acyl carrier protein
MVELVMDLEEEFGGTIPEDEAERIKTIADAISYIEQHRGA